MGQEVHVMTTYRFKPFPKTELSDIRKQLEDYALNSGLRGLVLLGVEGLNLTVSGDAQSIAGFGDLLKKILQQQDLFFKNSLTDKHPFHAFKVKIKPEIVTLGRPGMAPNKTQYHHLSPEEWNTALNEPDTVVIDTRNDYEVEIGKFKNAIDFGIKEFRDFPKAMQKSGINKDQKVLIYCTGGIRCEKAILELQDQGYKNVFQLDGGILNYIEKMPNRDFEGECFVFDYRVAVDQQLEPSKNYKLCPHCGQPGNNQIQCMQCGTDAIICKHCLQKDLQTCSKNCSHHHKLGSHSKKPHLQELKKRQHS